MKNNILIILFTVFASQASFAKGDSGHGGDAIWCHYSLPDFPVKEGAMYFLDYAVMADGRPWVMPEVPGLDRRANIDFVRSLVSQPTESKKGGVLWAFDMEFNEPEISKWVATPLDRAQIADEELKIEDLPENCRTNKARDLTDGDDVFLYQAAIFKNGHVLYDPHVDVELQKTGPLQVYLRDMHEVYREGRRAPEIRKWLRVFYSQEVANAVAGMTLEKALFERLELLDNSYSRMAFEATQAMEKSPSDNPLYLKGGFHEEAVFALEDLENEVKRLGIIQTVSQARPPYEFDRQTLNRIKKKVAHTTGLLPELRQATVIHKFLATRYVREQMGHQYSLFFSKAHFCDKYQVELDSTDRDEWCYISDRNDPINRVFFYSETMPRYSNDYSGRPGLANCTWEFYRGARKTTLAKKVEKGLQCMESSHQSYESRFKRSIQRIHELTGGQ